MVRLLRAPGGHAGTVGGLLMTGLTARGWHLNKQGPSVRMAEHATCNPGGNMPIAIGTKAPDFTLKSKTASGLVDVKLSSNFGHRNTVLLFFPLAFTSVCTAEMCDITAGLNAYKDLNADLIAVSVDSPFAQEAWAQKEKIGITLASDLNKEVTRAYEVEFKGLAGIGDTAARAAFVIDKSGVVQYAEQTPTPKDLPNFTAIKQALAKAS
jgi:peroxiredoxin